MRKPCAMPEVLLVTKPICPPWNDSGKLLPYLIARDIKGIEPLVVGVRGREVEGPKTIGLYRTGDSLRFSWGQKLRVFLWLLATPPPPVAHFFFSPNPVTSMAARLFRQAWPRSRTVQTVMSVPRDPRVLETGLFADAVIVWSEMAREMVTRAAARTGFRGAIIHVHPGVDPLAPMSDEERRVARRRFGLAESAPVVLFAGDAEFGGAAGVVAEAALGSSGSVGGAVWVFACREKTRSARRALKDLGEMTAHMVGEGRVRFAGEVEAFADLVRCADLQVLPAEDTFAKTDIPLVVLQGLTAGVPAIVATGTPMDELVSAGAAIGIPRRSPGVLAGEVERLIADRAALAKAGRTGREYALSRHTSEAMASAHATLYRRLLGEAP